MNVSQEITDCINDKFAAGEHFIDFDQVLHELYGDPKQYIEEFRNTFDGKYSQETKNLLMKAGIELLMTEEMLTIYEAGELKSNFASVVEDMVFGSGELRKESVDKRRLLLEKQFSINMALNELKLIRRDMDKFLEPMQNNPLMPSRRQQERLSRQKPWWMD